MKFNNGLVLSTVALALMATGCVKKQENVTASGTYNTPTTSNVSTPTTIYDTTGGATENSNYETAGPLVYDTGTGVTNSGTTYSEVIPDNTVITTDTSYGASSTNVTDYGTTTSNSSYGTTTNTTYSDGASSYGSGEIIDNYSDSQSSGAFSTGSSGSGGGSYSYGSYSEPSYSSPARSSSSSSSSSSYGSSSVPTGGGIHLQVAALKDYYAAEEFKKSLSLDPKYSVYIKRGALNKIIISGISSVNEANRLKERRFPGAFIVRNSGASSSSSSSYGSSSSSYGGGSSSYSSNYTDNTAYGSSYSSSSPSSSYSSSSASSGSVGIQIGAFGNRAKAQSVANANSGRHKAIVQKGTSRGRTIYRVILTGFSSRASAKRALASGEVANGFVTTIR